MPLIDIVISIFNVVVVVDGGVGFRFGSDVEDGVTVVLNFASTADLGDSDFGYSDFGTVVNYVFCLLDIRKQS